MENPGKIVKKIAIALFVIMVILSIFLARYVGGELPDRTEAIGAISAFIIGVAASACFSVLIYAFGDLVEKTSDTNAVVRKIESYTRNLKITYQDEQATEESTKREPELKAQQEAVARAKREVVEIAQKKAQIFSSPKSSNTVKTNEERWAQEIKTLSIEELKARSEDDYNWTEKYRELCHEELKTR